MKEVEQGEPEVNPRKPKGSRRLSVGFEDLPQASIPGSRRRQIRFCDLPSRATSNYGKITPLRFSRVTEAVRRSLLSLAAGVSIKARGEGSRSARAPSGRRQYCAEGLCRSFALFINTDGHRCNTDVARVPRSRSLTFARYIASPSGLLNA